MYNKEKQTPPGWVIKNYHKPFLGNSEYYRPLGAVDDLMHLQPQAIVHQIIHSTLGQ